MTESILGSSGMERRSAEDAIEAAKKMIDDGGMR
jgi:hypothetical protein